jgi:hypothetical protein
MENPDALFTEEQVWETCKSIAPRYAHDPYLVMAINQQECYHPRGDLRLYDASIVRKEQRYYEIYVSLKEKFATTVETKLADSWGTMQIMGLNLHTMGYFKWYFGQQDQAFFVNATSPFLVTAALDAFCTHLDWQIEWGCKHLEEKRKIARNNPSLFSEPDETRRMLLAWNGGSNRSYDDEVLARKAKLMMRLR